MKFVLAYTLCSAITGMCNTPVVHPVDFAYGAVAAELLPKIVRQYFSSQKEVEALMTKLAEYEEAEPTMSGAPATDGSNVSKANADLSFEDAIAAALG